MADIHVEMARLANQAYEDEALPGTTWQPVAAEQLGLAADGGSYRMEDGVYRARGALLSREGAVAHVYRGEVDGQDSLAVAFRGADPGSADDVVDFLTAVNSHYERFDPLVEGLKSFVATSGVERVVVTGHSLGGAMTQLFMQESEIRSDPRFEGVTFGSPGATVDERDARLIHFTHSQDPVGVEIPALAGDLLDLAGEVVRIPIEPRDVRNPPGQPFGSDEMSIFAPTEHAMDGYVLRIQDLFGVDPAMLPATLRSSVHDPDGSLSIVAGDGGDNFLAGDAAGLPDELDDLIFGRAGADRIEGRGGDDILHGGVGADMLDGGAGKDTVRYSGEEGRVRLTLQGETGTAITDSGTDQLLGIERAQGTGEADMLNGWNSPSSVAFTGLGGDDAVTGGKGNDSLRGSDGNDVLNGVAGNDFLDGGPGNDILQAGPGNDLLVGGTGSDQLSTDGAYADYTLAQSGDGWLLRDLFAGDGTTGADTLRGIETLVFSDRSIVIA